MGFDVTLNHAAESFEFLSRISFHVSGYQRREPMSSGKFTVHFTMAKQIEVVRKYERSIGRGWKHNL